MSRAARYVAWISRHTTAVIAATVLAVGAAAYLVVCHLPLYADLSYLLPEDAPAVRDAARLAERMPARDTMLMLVTAPNPAERARAGARAVEEVRAIEPGLIERLEADDADVRAFIGANQHLFVPLADLEAVRTALSERIAAAKARANPLFIDLDDEAPVASAALDDLRAKQQAARARLERSAFISADGKTQVLVIRTAFRATDIERDHALMQQLERIAAQIAIEVPSVKIGFTGGIPTTMAEHAALQRGILVSSLITAVLVALVLFLHLRSLRLLVLLTVNVLVGTLLALGSAAITVGHLNAATAFLGAIIAGNGVNYGILLTARFLEERRKVSPVGPPDARTAMAIAVAGTVRPTLIASLGAAIAYGALAATQFRGFADFAIIGGTGMLLCWVASFVLLPALILRFAPSPRRDVSPLFGTIVERVFAVRRPALAALIGTAVLVGALAVSWRFLANDPYEYDLTQLRSQAPDAVEARGWMKLSDDTFGRGLAGIGGQTFVAVDRADQVRPVVAALSARGADDPMVGSVGSILDVVPPDQAAKLAVLDQIRADIDAIAPELDAADRDELLALRPSDNLRAITPADLPPTIAAKLTERDGRIGFMVAVRPGPAFDEHDGHDLIAFAAAVREVKTSDGQTLSAAGPAVLFADVLTQIQVDGPIVTGIAALGVIIMVVLMCGLSRRSVAALVATFAGCIVMIAVCALAGLHINFLDFVALPITIGLGIDYAINVADRAASDDPLVALRSTGGAVLACSLTTIIGYTSLLASDNLAIRGFGLASLIGELTCMAAAFWLVPAILALPKLTHRVKGRHRIGLNWRQIEPDQSVS